MIARMVSCLKKTLFYLALSGTAVVLLLIGILFTNPGLKLVLWGAQKAVPEFSVNVETTEGALIPGFTIFNAKFTDQQLSVDLELNSLSLAINPRCFAKSSVCLERLELDGVDFTFSELPSTQEEPTENLQETSNEVSIPISVDLNNIELSNIKMNILGNKIDWDKMSTHIAMSGRTLTVYPTRLSDVNLELASAENSDSESKDNQTETGASPIVLPEVEIPLEIDLKEFALKNFRLRGDTPFTVNSLFLKAHADGNEVEIKQLELDTPQADLSLNTQLTLQGGYPIELQAHAGIKQTDLKGQKLDVTLSGSVENLNISASLSERVKASLEGKISPLDAGLPFSLSLLNGYLSWPFSGEAEYVVEVESLDASGSLDGYQFELDSRVNGQSVPELDLRVAGKGNLSQIELDTMTLDTLGGEVSGQVMANWQTPVNWKAALSLSDIQPGKQWKEAEGNISGSLTTSGELTETGGWHVVVPALNIDGIVRGYPLDLSGSIEASDPDGKSEFQLNTKGLNLKHGANGVYVEGNIDKAFHLNTKINFPDIAKSLPDLKGSLSGQLNLRGELKKPELETRLAASKIAFKDLVSVSALRLDGKIAPLPVPDGDIRLVANEMEVEGNKFDSLDLSFEGSQQDHHLSLSVLSELVKLNLSIAGGLEDKPEMNWVGTLNLADVETKQGPWRLNHPVNLRFLLDENVAKVQAHCWNQARSSVCLTQDIEAGKSGEAALAINNFNFDQIKMFIPESIKVQGSVNAVSKVKWSPGESPEAQAHIQLTEGTVVQNGESDLEFGWDSISANAVLKRDKLDLDWNIDLTDNGSLDGNAIIADIRSEEQSLEANLAIKQITMGMLEPILGDYSQLEAQLDSEIHVSGPVMHPSVTGELSLHDIAASGDITPVEVQKGRVNILFKGYEALLDADIETADGLLTVDGNAGWKNMSAWYTNIKVHSNELNVNLPPMVRVKVKPDMAITLTPELAKITGDIYLPWGRITIEELPPSAVSVSSDQVILDENLKPVEGNRAIPMGLETDVNIHIGDEFKLSAFGLKGGLKGNLNVTQKDKGPFIVGEINVKDGTYRSFGQDLIIKEGKILMNGPADQPYLQVTAIRNPDNTSDNVTAGIKVTGSASEPQIEIYSDPAMPQQNALSYLLRGQNIDGEAGGNAMTTALIGLSLARSGRIVGEIGEAFGVSELQLDTEGAGEDSQVTVSGYILPGLQVKYGVGIFDAIGAFTVRYRLMQDLYLEAVSGTDSAMDLLYQFEFE